MIDVKKKDFSVKLKIFSRNIEKTLFEKIFKPSRIRLIGPPQYLKKVAYNTISNNYVIIITRL